MPTMRLRTPFVSAEITTTAAMLLDAAFRIGDREVRPLARAPWLGEPGLDALPGHLRVLAGDFVAVPFGASAAPAGTAPEWVDVLPTQEPALPHGPGADAEWTVVEQSADRVVLTLAYPQDDAVERLERTIRLRADAPVIEFELVIHARRAARIPVGLHPILALPAAPGALELEVGFAGGYTYPGPPWPGRGRTAPARRFASLAAAPGPSGPVDLSRLPFDEPVEDIVLLAGVSTPVRARNRELGVSVVVDWDRTILPAVMLWISDRALQETPWQGRYRGLGVEPIAAAFDFGEAASAGANPIADDGHRTAVELGPDAPVRITSSIAVGV
jgi:hypothetical protein